MAFNVNRRAAIDDHLRRRGGPSWGEIVEGAISAVGCGHSGLGDLAQRHDDYFVESVEDRIDD